MAPSALAVGLLRNDDCALRPGPSAAAAAVARAHLGFCGGSPHLNPEVCVDMCVGKGVGMYADMCVDMCADMCVEM